jgi:dTDP-4-dehydrorhamnose reductase
MKLSYRSRVVITGAAGMVGSTFVSSLSDRCVCYGLGRKKDSLISHVIDLTHVGTTQRVLNEIHPTLVIHCAALTNLEYCEQYPDEAELINIGITNTIVTWCEEHDVPLVYISTAGIFDGMKEWYKEEDIPNPPTIYGKTKLRAEQRVVQYKKSYIFRAGWMIGGGPNRDKKMIGKLMNQIQADAPRLSVVNDIYGTITYTPDLVSTILSVLPTQQYGIFHIAAPERLTRFEIAEKLLINIKKPIELIPVKSSDLKSAFFAHRPKSEALLSQRLQHLSLYRHRTTDDILSEYIKLWQ